ncbi:MAG TPA: hypothetical protein VEX18_06980 [Polyangiaceae bacterium]|nr:hypothetical protein [Polyangiaceae bacterium]
MATLIREGGFPMFFLLAFGLSALALAVRFAVAPSQRALRAALALSAATAFTAITGICAAFAAVGHQAPDYLKRHPESSLAEVVLLGIGESMSPGILGFTMLSLIAIVLALGVWRQNPA